MLRLGVLSFVIAVLYANASIASDGPFGVSMGDSVDQYGCNTMDKSSFYICESVPRRHPEFETYVVQYHHTTGICWLKGVGRNIDGDRYGLSVKSRMDDVRDQISPKYGAPSNTHDFLSSGSIWDEAEDWAMGIAQNERFYAFQWKSPTASDVKEIYVAAQAIDSRTTYVVVEFYLQNYDDCKEAIQTDAASAF